MDGLVRMELDYGTKVDASALLACDGIHSAIRKHMHKDVDDHLSYRGQECWWGKTTVKLGSELDEELRRLIASKKTLVGNDGNTPSIFVIGTNKRPGCFFSDEVAPNEHAWGYVVASKIPSTNQARYPQLPMLQPI